ncbi:MAG TPA: GNAT family N-acetyltransferase [Candidatus Dormibacteraeota bacterium]|nr:GNAT family N-acetyltransferase [Candidatus Dormibacteraeota bacterium]
MIRPAKVRDLTAVSKLAAQSIENDYGFYPPHVKQQLKARNSKRSLLTTIIRRQRLILVAEDNGRIVGYIIANPNNDSVALVYSIYVDGAARKKGIGRALLNEFEKQYVKPPVSKIMVWTEIAPDYYRRLGWSEEAGLKNHWWGQDWVIFVKPVNNKNSISSINKRIKETESVSGDAE